MRYTKTLLPAAMIALAISQPAFAEDDEKGDWLPGEFAASATLTSDYMFRGISQTDNNPAMQGSLEYSVDSGFYGITPYLGVWGSNVNFKDGDNAQVELDTLFGLRGDIPDTKISWDLGGIYYAYPGASRSGGQATNYNYWEVSPKLSYSPIDIVTLTASYYYSPDYFGATGEANYLNGMVEVTPEVPYVDLTLFGGVGHQWVGPKLTDYTDWTLGATVTIKGVDFTVAYVDTDLTQADNGGNTISNGRAVFSVGTSF